MSKWQSVKRIVAVLLTGSIAVLAPVSATYSDDRGRPELVMLGMPRSAVEALMGPSSPTMSSTDVQSGMERQSVPRPLYKPDAIDESYWAGTSSFDTAFVNGKLARVGKSAPLHLARSAPPTPMVFFDAGTTTLGPQSEQQLKRAVQSYEGWRGSATVVLLAHTDSSEARSHSPDLSRRRGEIVMKRLIALGIPRDRIEVRALGDSSPLVVASPGAAEPQNRRVEILVWATHKD